MNEMNNIVYDVAFSFAGAQREYVEKVRNELSKYHISVFYDNDNSVNLWGKNLYRYLNEIYSKKARYCVIFISKEYKERPWTIHESQSAQERMFNSYNDQNFQEYILPVRFDDTIIPGIRNTTGCMNANEISPEELAKYIVQKVNSDNLGKTLSYTAVSLFEHMKAKLCDYVKTEINIQITKSENIIHVTYNVSEQILTFQLIEKYIYLYLEDFSLGENPSAIFFINNSHKQLPIKIISFSPFLGNSPELNVDINEFNNILENMFKHLLEVIG